MSTRKLGFLAVILAIFIFTAFAVAGDAEKPNDEKAGGEQVTPSTTPPAPETPGEEEARIRKKYSKYAIVFFDIEETVVHLDGKKEKVSTGGFAHILSFGFKLTAGRSYKGDKWEEYRKKMNLAGVDNSHLWFLKTGSKKPKRNKKDKQEKSEKFTAEELRKYAQYVISGTLTMTEKESRFYGKKVAFRFDGELDLKITRTSDGKEIWAKNDSKDMSATERGGGKEAALQLVRKDFVDKYAAAIIKLPEWAEAKKKLKEAAPEEPKDKPEDTEKKPGNSEKQPEGADEK